MDKEDRLCFIDSKAIKYYINHNGKLYRGLKEPSHSLQISQQFYKKRAGIAGT